MSKVNQKTNSGLLVMAGLVAMVCVAAFFIIISEIAQREARNELTELRIIKTKLEIEYLEIQLGKDHE